MRPWSDRGADRRPPPSGNRRRGIAALVAALLLAPSLAGAVSIFDLVHDTPAVRKKYQMDIVGFASEGGGFAADEGTQSADTIWATRMKYVKTGETEKADAQVEGLIAWRLDRGRNNLVNHSTLLIREAFREAEGGGFDRAAILIDWAGLLAPDFPAVPLAEGYLGFLRNRLNVAAPLRGLVEAIGAASREAYHYTLLLGRLSGATVVIMLLVSAGWAVAVLGRYGGLLGHDLKEYLSGGRKHFALRQRLIALVLVFLPLALFMTPLWLIVLAMSLPWAYQGRTERAITVAVVLLVAALPLVARYSGALLDFQGDDVTQALMAARNGSETAAHVAALESANRATPGDAAVVFSLAQHAWRDGIYEEAERRFSEVRDRAGALRVPAIINLGNIRLALGDPQGAGDLYRQAVSVNDRSAAAHYNLAQVHNLRFAFPEGEAEMKLAMALDRRLISQGQTTAGQGPLRTVVSENLPMALLMQRLNTGHAPRGVPVWDLAMTGVSPKLFPAIVALLFGLGLVFAAVLQRRGLARRCAKCGRPYCPFCQPSSAKLPFCLQCQSIFVQKEGVESARRAEKLVAINDYQQRHKLLGYLLSILVPGAGQVHFGAPLAGLSFIFLAALLTPPAFGWHGPFIDRYQMVFPWDRTGTILAVAALAAVWALNLVSAVLMGRRSRG